MFLSYWLPCVAPVDAMTLVLCCCLQAAAKQADELYVLPADLVTDSGHLSWLQNPFLRKKNATVAGIFPPFHVGPKSICRLYTKKKKFWSFFGFHLFSDSDINHLFNNLL